MSVHNVVAVVEHADLESFADAVVRVFAGWSPVVGEVYRARGRERMRVVVSVDVDSVLAVNLVWHRFTGLLATTPVSLCVMSAEEFDASYGS